MKSIFIVLVNALTLISSSTKNIDSYYFYYESIPNSIKEEMINNSYKENDYITFDDLSLVHILYKGFDDKIHKGELIVNKKIASDIVEIFKVLYENNYKIESVERIDKYNGDDNLSMKNNNTSAFNYRNIEGTNTLSNHSYGLALDLNPLYNPYVYESNGNLIVSPIEGVKYIDRTLEFPYKIDKNDLAYKEFTKRGFTWGGDWLNKKDYQHFEKIN